jgi:hypothetical protein
MKSGLVFPFKDKEVAFGTPNRTRAQTHWRSGDTWQAWLAAGVYSEPWKTRLSTRSYAQTGWPSAKAQ